MEASLYIRDQGTVKTVVFYCSIEAEERQEIGSANNVMATVFWNMHGTIHIDHIKKSKRSLDYIVQSCLTDLMSIWYKNYHQEKVLIHKDNAPAQNGKIPWITLCIGSSFTIFSSLYPQRLLSIPKS